MLTLIIGGAASGKSEFAEQLVLSLPGQRVYAATMEPCGQESLDRIQKHRCQREGKGFLTLERYRDLGGLEVPAGANVLLECMGNLLANELYSPQGGGSAAVLGGVERLYERCAHLTIVTNEVFSGGTDYEGDTLRYLRELGGVNRSLAARAELVVEVVCGQANVLKGRLP